MENNKLIVVEGIGIGIKEIIHNPHFNRVGFDTVRSNAAGKGWVYEDCRNYEKNNKEMMHNDNGLQ